MLDEVNYRNKEKTDETSCGATRETNDVQTYDVTWKEMYSVKCRLVFSTSSVRLFYFT